MDRFAWSFTPEPLKLFLLVWTPVLAVVLGGCCHGDKPIPPSGLHHYDHWFPLSQPHICTLHPNMTCLTWDVAHLTHRKSNLAVGHLCVQECLLPQHVLLNVCGLEDLWDYYTPVRCLEARLSADKAPWTPAPNIILTSFTQADQVWIAASSPSLFPLLSSTPTFPEIALVHDSGSQPTWSPHPNLQRGHPWKHVWYMTGVWKIWQGNTEKDDWQAD